MSDRNARDWRDLCAEASQELDSEKLVSLVDQILQELDENLESRVDQPASTMKKI